MMSDINNKEGEVKDKKDEKMNPSDDETQAKYQDPDDQEKEIYPLRKSSEDPRWAVRTVWIWVSFAVASLLFILILLFLSIFYD